MPFGVDTNDLPLHQFQEDFNKVLLMLMHESTDHVPKTSRYATTTFDQLIASSASINNNYSAAVDATGFFERRVTPPSTHHGGGGGGIRNSWSYNNKSSKSNEDLGDTMSVGKSTSLTKFLHNDLDARAKKEAEESRLFKLEVGRVHPSHSLESKVYDARFIAQSCPGAHATGSIYERHTQCAAPSLSVSQHTVSTSNSAPDSNDERYRGYSGKAVPLNVNALAMESSIPEFTASDPAQSAYGRMDYEMTVLFPAEAERGALLCTPRTPCWRLPTLATQSRLPLELIPDTPTSAEVCNMSPP
jgi:hypothetical protein